MAVRINLSKRMFPKAWMSRIPPRKTAPVESRAWFELYFDTYAGDVMAEVHLETDSRL